MDKRKTFLIIGGSKGIGRALLGDLIENNTVINVSRTVPKVDHKNLAHYSLDILKDDLPELERLDGLVYCPGSIVLKSFGRLELEDYRADFEINVLGAIRTIKKYAKSLSASGSASVVLFSTVATKMGMPYHASVAVSKSAVEGLTKTLAAEYATKIRFNCIAPTVTDTTLAEKLLRNDKIKEKTQKRHPLNKYLQPGEVADFAAYLLSDKADAISGQIISIDAGIVTLKI